MDVTTVNPAENEAVTGDDDSRPQTTNGGPKRIRIETGEEFQSIIAEVLFNNSSGSKDVQVDYCGTESLEELIPTYFKFPTEEEIAKIKSCTGSKMANSDYDSFTQVIVSGEGCWDNKDHSRIIDTNVLNEAQAGQRASNSAEGQETFEIKCQKLISCLSNVEGFDSEDWGSSVDINSNDFYPTEVFSNEEEKEQSFQDFLRSCNCTNGEPTNLSFTAQTAEESSINSVHSSAQLNFGGVESADTLIESLPIDTDDNFECAYSADRYENRGNFDNGNLPDEAITCDFIFDMVLNAAADRSSVFHSSTNIADDAQAQTQRNLEEGELQSFVLEKYDQDASISSSFPVDLPIICQPTEDNSINPNLNIDVITEETKIANSVIAHSVIDKEVEDTTSESVKQVVKTQHKLPAETSLINVLHSETKGKKNPSIRNCSVYLTRINTDLIKSKLKTDMSSSEDNDKVKTNVPADSMLNTENGDKEETCTSIKKPDNNNDKSVSTTDSPSLIPTLSTSAAGRNKQELNEVKKALADKVRETVNRLKSRKSTNQTNPSHLRHSPCTTEEEKTDSNQSKHKETETEIHVSATDKLHTISPSNPFIQPHHPTRRKSLEESLIDSNVNQQDQPMLFESKLINNSSNTKDVKIKVEPQQLEDVSESQPSTSRNNIDRGKRKSWESALPTPSSRVKKEISRKQALPVMIEEAKYSNPDFAVLRKTLDMTFDARKKYIDSGKINVDTNHIVNRYPALKFYQMIKEEYGRRVPKPNINTMDRLEGYLKPFLINGLTPKKRIRNAHDIWEDTLKRYSGTAEGWTESEKHIMGMIAVCFKLTENATVRNLCRILAEDEDPEKMDTKDLVTPTLVFKKSQLYESETEMWIYAEAEKIFKVPNFYEGVLCVYAAYYVFNLVYDKKLEALLHYFDSLVDIPQTTYAFIC